MITINSDEQHLAVALGISQERYDQMAPAFKAMDDDISQSICIKFIDYLFADSKLNTGVNKAEVLKSFLTLAENENEAIWLSFEAGASVQRIITALERTAKRVPDMLQYITKP